MILVVASVDVSVYVSLAACSGAQTARLFESRDEWRTKTVQLSSCSLHFCLTGEYKKSLFLSLCKTQSRNLNYNNEEEEDSPGSTSHMQVVGDTNKVNSMQQQPAESSGSECARFTLPNRLKAQQTLFTCLPGPTCQCRSCSCLLLLF